jgi:hypothetical protein
MEEKCAHVIQILFGGTDVRKAPDLNNAVEARLPAVVVLHPSIELWDFGVEKEVWIWNFSGRARRLYELSGIVCVFGAEGEVCQQMRVFDVLVRGSGSSAL